MNRVRDEMREPTLAVAADGAMPSSPLAELVARTVAGLGYELVDLERAGHGLLRVTLDLAAADGAGGAGRIGIDDCERVSRQLTHLFAVEGIDYDRLEVSSPGMDRPLRGARDFMRFAGAMVKVQLYSPIDGRRRLRGRLLGLVSEPAAAQGASDRVRMTLVPEPPPPGPRGKRGSRARKVEVGETLEFALAEVEKARLAPEWEFDRDAIDRTAQSRTE